MAFSRNQHAFHFRPMVDSAWKAHCTVHQLDPRDRAAKEEWYRLQLHQRLGVYSTKECNKTKHFESLMAHFEEIAGNGIKWQLRFEGGDSRRLIHKIHTICAEHHLEEDYVRGLARQSLRLQSLPILERLETAQLLMLLKALRKDADRISASANKPDCPF